MIEDAQADGSSSCGQVNLVRRGDPSYAVVVEALYQAETLAVRCPSLAKQDILDGNGAAPVGANIKVTIGIGAPPPNCFR